jgi:hypothetical protein
MPWPDLITLVVATGAAFRLVQAVQGRRATAGQVLRLGRRRDRINCAGYREWMQASLHMDIAVS